MSSPHDAEPDPRTAAGSNSEAPIPTVFPPTLREVLLRPKWLALLAFCLLVAGVFAWLGQWQLGRAIDLDPPEAGLTEQVRPLEDVVAPGEYLEEPLVGQKVTTSGHFVPGDFLIVSSRFNDGEAGYWVTGQLRIDSAEAPTSVAVALGWAKTEDDAHAAIAALNETADATDAPVEITGRLISDEGPAVPEKDADPQSMSRMSPAALLSQWHDIAELDVYRQYVASLSAPDGLVDIHSPAPAEGSRVNWLNIFYAVEWAIFAGFAFYLWYRLAKDEWEREIEDLEDAAAEAAEAGSAD